MALDLCADINKGIKRGCRQNAGGIYEFYIATYPTELAVEKFTAASEYYAEDGKDYVGAINAIDSISGTPLDFYKFVPNKNSSSVETGFQISDENGTTGFEQKVNMIFAKMEQDKANQVYKLAYKDGLIVAKDKNDNFFLLGEGSGMTLSGGTEGSGKALTDLNGYSLEFTGLEGSPAAQIAIGISDSESTPTKEVKLVSDVSDPDNIIYTFEFTA